MRPIYERPDNILTQWNVAFRLLTLKGAGWSLKMTEPLTAHDAVLEAVRQPARLYEVKVRKVAFMGSYIERGGYMIAKQKLDRIVLNARDAGAHFGVAVDCPDGLWVTTLSRMPPDATVATGGRWDRGDPMDVELCYFLPARYFRRVSDPVNHLNAEAGTGAGHENWPWVVLG
jgi:hypothetical protein